MKKATNNKEVTPVPNPLGQYDPCQPEYIPENFIKSYKRSVYFPEQKAAFLYKMDQMIKELTRAGSKLSFNDVMIEALELWCEETERKYLARVLYRLEGEKSKLLGEAEALAGNARRNRESMLRHKELLNRYKKMVEAVSEIEAFLSVFQRNIPSGNYEALPVEIIKSLKQHCWPELSKALSNVLGRSGIHDLVVQFRRTTKRDSRMADLIKVIEKDVCKKIR